MLSVVWHYHLWTAAWRVGNMDLNVRENSPELALLAGLILSAVGSFVPVGWTPGLEVLVWSSLGGLVVGFL